MDFDLGRSPAVVPGHQTGAGFPTLTQRVRARLGGVHADGDPVAHLLRAHKTVHSDANTSVLRMAYDVAERMHRGQTRKSGEPYITHPLAVAQILAELGMDTTTLVAALLHDTVEDTNYTMRQLRGEFGDEVALLVDGVTKFDKVFYGEVAEAETYRKMIVTAGEDVRVLVVKLADRLHNMRTLDARSPSSRIRIARATQDVLVPLCDRLGIQALKRELEDSVLAALEPDEYDRLAAYVQHRPAWTAYLHRFIDEARAAVRQQKVSAKVESRPRHLYTIWKDTVAVDQTVPRDLPRIVVVVNGTETDCYMALGAIHSRWRPVPGRFKDFVASPKNNLYRSLHTTVLGQTDQPVEVLIRTEAMHRNAEYGIVAAYRFPARTGPRKSAGRKATGGAEHLAWLRGVVEWQREAVDPRRFLESLRCDLAEGQLHVFAGGTRLLLPAGATPVDVAYALGEEMGSRCVSATVNGQLARLSLALSDGDVVEIHTARSDEATAPDGGPIGPSRDWLSFVRTPHAQLMINRWLAENEDVNPDEAPPVPIPARVRIGRRALGLALLRRERSLASEAPLLALVAELNYPDVETLLVAVADHRISADEVAAKLIMLVDRASAAAQPRA